MTTQDYDKENDIICVYFGGKKEIEHSVELFNGSLILDFDKKHNIVGFEIFDFMKQIKQHDKQMEKIFKRFDKKRTKEGSQ